MGGCNNVRQRVENCAFRGNWAEIGYLVWPVSRVRSGQPRIGGGGGSMLRDKEGPWSTHTHAPLHGLELQMRVFGAEGHVTMALIDARREGRSFLFFFSFFYFLPFFGCWGWKKGWGKRARSNRGVCKGKRPRTRQMCTTFPSLIEEKYYFIHAISVHSSAGASLDSLFHLHTDILINGSDVSTACSPGWRREGGGGGRGGHVVSEGIYNKVALFVGLKTFTQVCVLRHCRSRANTSAADREIRRFIYGPDDGRRLKRESEKERERAQERERVREREKEEGKRYSLRWCSIHELILALPALSFTTSPRPHWDSR